MENFVWKLTGKETIYQMMALADAVRARGGQPLEPSAYKKLYLERLWGRIERPYRRATKRASGAPEEYMVPGARELLEGLRDRGLTMYLASGTDHAYMTEEARLLGLTQYFAGGVYGAQDDYKSFSKAILIQRILSSAGFRRPPVPRFRRWLR